MTILDVRRNDEFDTSHIDGALNFPMHELLNRIDEIPKQHVLVHCESGYRASIAASLLDRAGRAVTLIDDSWDRARNSGLPIIES